MKPIPYIPENESLTDLLDMMSSSAKFKDRVAQLKELQDLINKDLGDREIVERVKNQQSLAVTKLAEAEAIRKRADEYVATRKAEADDVYAKRMDQIQKAENDSSTMAKELSARATELTNRSQSLDARDNALEKEKQSVAVLQQQAVTAKESADRTRGIYEEKTRQLKLAMGG